MFDNFTTISETTFYYNSWYTCFIYSVNSFPNVISGIYFYTNSWNTFLVQFVEEIPFYRKTKTRLQMWTINILMNAEVESSTSTEINMRSKTRLQNQSEEVKHFIFNLFPAPSRRFRNRILHQMICRIKTGCSSIIFLILFCYSCPPHDTIRSQFANLPKNVKYLHLVFNLNSNILKATLSSVIKDKHEFIWTPI